MKNSSDGYFGGIFRLCDPRYRFESTNPAATPTTKLDYNDPVSNLGSVVMVYVDVVKVRHVSGV